MKKKGREGLSSQGAGKEGNQRGEVYSSGSANIRAPLSPNGDLSADCHLRGPLTLIFSRQLREGVHAGVFCAPSDDIDDRSYRDARGNRNVLQLLMSLFTPESPQIIDGNVHG